MGLAGKQTYSDEGLFTSTAALIAQIRCMKQQQSGVRIQVELKRFKYPTNRSKKDGIDR